MLTWAAIVTLISGTLASLEGGSSMLMNLAELAGVVALFALVCAAEAFSGPRE